MKLCMCSTEQKVEKYKITTKGFVLFSLHSVFFIKMRSESDHELIWFDYHLSIASVFFDVVFKHMLLCY